MRVAVMSSIFNVINFFIAKLTLWCNKRVFEYGKHIYSCLILSCSQPDPNMCMKTLGKGDNYGKYRNKWSMGRGRDSRVGHSRNLLLLSYDQNCVMCSLRYNTKYLELIFDEVLLDNSSCPDYKFQCYNFLMLPN